MIHVQNKVDCCGCAACGQICPRKCITMFQDEEGFFYPRVDVNSCVQCGRCDKVCPIQNKRQAKSLLKAFAFNLNDEAARYESASGGFFTAIANVIIRSGGVVFGVAYNESMRVVTTFTEQLSEIYKFRNSKYVQSWVGSSFDEVKSFLKTGRLVLYSGTPCQIQGLLNFLGKEYDNLWTVDLVCHGVPSPKVFEKYKQYIKSIYGKNVIDYTFRTKRKGYNGRGYSCANIKLADGNVIRTEEKNESYRFMANAFFEELCSRPSCHHCKFKDKERVSDFTVFDCWSVKKIAPQLDDNRGTTLLVVNSEHGQSILNKIANYSSMIPVKLEKAIKLDGLVMINSVPAHPRRKDFFVDLDKLSVEQLTEKYLTPRGWRKFKFQIRKFLENIGILRYIRLLRYKFVSL